MIALRQAEASDADVIARLHAASWREHYRGMLADAYLDGDLVAAQRIVALSHDLRVGDGAPVDPKVQVSVVNANRAGGDLRDRNAIDGVGGFSSDGAWSKCSVCRFTGDSVACSGAGVSMR